MKTDELFIDGHKLPQPLSNEELYKLLEATKEGSKEALDKIVLHNIRLVLYEVTTKFQYVNYDKKDLISIGNFGLIKAINTYDLSKKSEFVTYAIRCIDNEIFMFLRKLKKDQSVESLDRTVFQNKDGSETKLENLISDGTDLVEDYVNVETHMIIREVVKELPDRDREIIMLYYGFYNDKIYTLREIAKKLGISYTYVAKKIKIIVKEVGEILESKGVIELHSKHSEVKEKENKNNKPKLHTKNPIFNQMMSELSVKEAVIISLKLGYIDGKYFSTKSVAEFLGIEEEEVRETTKKVLLVYKDGINEFLDNAIAMTTDQVGQAQELSMIDSTIKK